MVDRNEPPLLPGEFNRLYPTSDQALRSASDSQASPNRDKTSREIAQDILARRLAEDRAADRRAEGRQGDRDRALEEFYRERGY